MHRDISDHVDAETEHEITAKEVSDWFPDGKHGRPDTAICWALASSFDLARVLRSVVPSNSQSDPAAANFREMVAEARQLKLTISKFDRVNRLPPIRQIDAIRTALTEFLAVTPTHQGRPAEVWATWALKWMPDVHAVLVWHVRMKRDAAVRELRDGPGDRCTNYQKAQALAQKPPPLVSQNSVNGPVVTVLAKALDRVFGWDIDNKSISDALTHRKSRQPPNN